MPTYTVAIVEQETERTVSTYGPYEYRATAERCERGVSINMDGERFYTEIRET